MRARARTTELRAIKMINPAELAIQTATANLIAYTRTASEAIPRGSHCRRG